MTRAPDASTEPRAPLNRERVLEAAMRIADEGGFESLSMRRLGQELGVQAMSLYNHVANKNDIRDGIVDLVMNEIEVPTPGADWKVAIRRSAVSAHDAFVRHPWSANLQMESSVSPARMRWMEGVLRTLREAGFSANLTHYAYHALDSHITGFSLWQVSMPFDTREELVDLAERFLREIPVDVYPYVVEHAREHMQPPDPDAPTAFEFGLDLILDGLERLRKSAH